MELIKAKGISFYYVREEGDVGEAIEMLSQGDRFAADTETRISPSWEGRSGSALDPHTGAISLLIMAVEGMPPFVIDIQVLSDESGRKFIELLNRKEYSIWHNAKFDWQFIKSHFGIELRRVHCTMVMSQLLGNALGSKFARARGHGYADVCRDLLGVHIEGKKSLRKTTWGIGNDARVISNEWWLEKLAYAARDTAYLFEIHDQLEEVLTRPLPLSRMNPTGVVENPGVEMREVLELEWRLTTTTARIEYTGMPVSKPMLDAIAEAIDEELNATAVRLCKEFDLEINAPSMWEEKEIASPNSLKTLRSPEKMRELIGKAVGLDKLSTTEGVYLERLLSIIDQIAKGATVSGEEDTDGANTSLVDFVSEEERAEFRDLEEVEEASLNHSSQLVKDVLTFKRLVKVQSMDLRNYINVKTGRLQFKLQQGGTATGRFSSCIAEGQRVLVPGGEKPIEEIKPGDLVYCYTDDGHLTLRKVTNWWCKDISEVVKLDWKAGSVAGGKERRTGSLICTKDHKLKTRQRGWVECKDLRVGESIYHVSKRFSYHKNRSEGNKYLPTLNYVDGQRGQTRLEQLVIKEICFGNKEGWEIHHKDRNVRNNSLDNLEYLSKQDHRKLHGLENLERRPWEKVYPSCCLKRSFGESNPVWIKKSKFSLLKMLAKSKGRPSKVDMDFECFKRKCQLEGIDIKEVAKRYGSTGVYLNESNVIKSLLSSETTEQASKLLGIGTRRLKKRCEELGINYSNHKVVSVEPAGYSIVYDIEVEEFNNFICEDLCVHNSGPNVQQIPARLYLKALVSFEDLFRATSNAVQVWEGVE